MKIVVCEAAIHPSAPSGDDILNEYRELRAEMLQKVELHNTLLTFLYTTVAAVFGLAVALSNSSICLLAFVVIVPVSLRISYYRDATAKMAAYQIVYIEPELGGVRWESLNARVYDLIQRRSAIREGSVSMALVSKLRYYDFFLLCISSLIVYYALGGFEYGQAWITVTSVVLTLFELSISIKSSSISHSRAVWVKRWRKLKAEEELFGRLRG